MLRVFRKELLTLLLLFIIHVTLTAQYSKDAFYHYTVKDGLPSMNCYDILQDHSGFLWIATEGGLSKFNGKEFKSFTVMDGLPSNEVVDLLLDSKNRIWLNASGPLSYLESNQIKQMESEVSTLLSWSFGIGETDLNDLWLHESSVIRRFDIETLEPLPISFELTEISKGRNIIGSSGESIYVIGMDSLYKLNWNKKISSIPLIQHSKSKPYNERFYHLHGSFLFYSSPTGLEVLNIETQQSKSILETTSIIEQLIVDEDRVWIKMNDCIHYIDINEEMNVIQSTELLTDFKAAHIHIDKNKNLWASTEKDGLYLFPYISDAINNVNLSEHCSNNIRSIHIEENGSLYLGTSDAEVIKITEGQISRIPFNIQRKNDANRILDIIRLDDDYLLGSADNGIVLFNDQSSKHIIRSSCKRVSKNKDTVLINTYNSLVGTSIETLKNLNYIGLDANGNREKYFSVYNDYRCYSSLRDSRGRLWIGDAVRGLLRVTKNDTLHYQSLSNLFKVGIVKIIELTDGRICLATNGRGLIIVDDLKFFRIDSSNGLSSNICYDVESLDNKIFVGTNKGVNIITIDEAGTDFSVVTYGTLNGLASDDIYVLKAFKDTLYLGTNKGLSKINHQTNIKNEPVDYSTNIDQVSINGFKRSNQDLQNLDINENNILISFESPVYGNQEERSFQYRLNGVDNDWIDTRSNETHYSSLAPGKYLFEVGLKESDETGPKNLQSINFHIKPKWHQTWWTKFIIILGVISLAIFPFIYSVSLNQRTRLSNLVDQRTEELALRMNELSQSNKQLSQSNQELEQFAFIASHDLQEPLNTLIGFSGVLKNKWEKKDFQNSEKILSIIEVSSLRMKDLIRDMLEFSRIGTHGKKIEVESQELIDEVLENLASSIAQKDAIIKYSSLPKIKVHATEFKSLIQNLLSNALKFQKPSTQAKITIEVTEEEKYHHFRIADNGIGISKEGHSKVFQVFQRMHTKDEYKGTGIGLAHCKKIVELHGGNIWIDSELDKGTTIHFRMAKS